MYAATMDILVLQIFNSLFYASVLFLIARRPNSDNQIPLRRRAGALCNLTDEFRLLRIAVGLPYLI